MNHLSRLTMYLAILFASVLLRAHAAEQEVVPDDKCLECHGMKDLSVTNAVGQARSLFTDEAILKASSHGTNRCVDCHRDLRFAWEHPDDKHVVEPVNCALCHEKSSVTASAGVHGMALREGTITAATCRDCHGHHDVQRHTSPNSSTYFTRLASTCGQCHVNEAEELQMSVHGVAAARGRRDAPTCIDCHSEHQTEDLRKASPLKISEQICGRCHASERLNTSIRSPRRQVDTFLESYHGLAVQGGSTRAANCASCHGWHKILSSSDPRSTIHRDNLSATCGKCHPGAGANFSAGRVHVDYASTGEIGLTVNSWVRRAYLALIIGVIGLLGLHNGVSWYQKVRAAFRAPGRTVVRMDDSQRRQHLVLLSSFILLALTGFALRFPDSWLSWVFGTEDTRRWLHRVSGVVLLAVGAWHVLYILIRVEGRKLFRDMLPAWQDVKDLRTNVRHLAGVDARKARFGRFGYPEKLEYWAVVWGSIIMGVTGLMIWFKIDVTRFVPRWAIDVAVTIHYYEAILACLAIVVWHFYHVLFDPDVYPSNWAWLDGRVTPEWQRHEHPLEERPVGEDSSPSAGKSGGRQGGAEGKHVRRTS